MEERKELQPRSPSATELIGSLTIKPSSIKGMASPFQSSPFQSSPYRSSPLARSARSPVGIPAASTNATSPPRIIMPASFGDDASEYESSVYDSSVGGDETASFHTSTRRMYIGGSHFDDSSVGTFSTYNTSTLGGSTVYEDAMSCISSLDLAIPRYPPISSPPPAMPSLHKPAPPVSSAPPVQSASLSKNETEKENDRTEGPTLVISIGKSCPQKVALDETDATPVKRNVTTANCNTTTTSLTSATTMTTNDATHPQTHLSAMPERHTAPNITQPSLASTSIASSPTRLHMPHSQSSVASSSVDYHDYDTQTSQSFTQNSQSLSRNNASPPPSPTRKQPASSHYSQPIKNEIHIEKKKKKSILSIKRAKNKIAGSVFGSMFSSSNSKHLSLDNVSKSSKRASAYNAVNSSKNSSKHSHRPSSSASVSSKNSKNSSSTNKSNTHQPQPSQLKFSQHRSASTSRLITTPEEAFDEQKPISAPVLIKSSSHTDLHQRANSYKHSKSPTNAVFPTSTTTTIPTNDVHESERRRKDQSNVERDTLQALWQLGIGDDEDDDMDIPYAQNTKKKNRAKKDLDTTTGPRRTSQLKQIPDGVPSSIQVAMTADDGESLSKTEPRRLDDEDLTIDLPQHLQQSSRPPPQADDYKYPQQLLSHAASKAESDDLDDAKSTSSQVQSRGLSPTRSPPRSSVQELTNQLIKERAEFKIQTKANSKIHQQQMEEVMQSVNVVEKEYMTMIDDLHSLLQQKEENLNSLSKQLSESKATRKSLEEREQNTKRQLAELGVELERTRMSYRDAQAKSERVVERLEKQCEEKDVAMQTAVKTLKEEVSRQFEEGDEMYEVLMEQFTKVKNEKEELIQCLEQMKKQEDKEQRDRSENILRMRDGKFSTTLTLCAFLLFNNFCSMFHDSHLFPAIVFISRFNTAIGRLQVTPNNGLSIEVERDIVVKQNSELTKLCEELLSMVETSSSRSG